MSIKARLFDYWHELYPQEGTRRLEKFLSELKPEKNKTENTDWYKEAIVYSLYVDLFAGDINGLTGKLDYIEELGVNCLWLLPILDSPMRDGGFDIRHYDRIRADLLGLPQDFSQKEQENVFGTFLQEAHARNIKVIFDIAINHTSDEHPWFKQALSSRQNPYRHYYIWSKTGKEYAEARIIFKGIETSNWQKAGDEYYFHRFFHFQPDLNYKNPEVLLAMSRHLLYWQQMGVDGFRADAIPYLWKEEGTYCENLPKTHTVVKFFRAILDYVKPGTLLLAEACQQPHVVVKYLGNGDECHAAYHFPLMPQMFKALSMQSGEPVKKVLSPAVTPHIPPSTQWFTFLRLHDELSLELVYVSEEDRKYIHEHYCHQPEWDFRVGEGISARLAELMKRNPDDMTLAYSLMLTLIGTPVVYYGDEFGKLNDEAFYREMIQLTGKDDTRFLVRGKVDWTKLEQDLADPKNFHAQVFAKIKPMLNIRRKNPVFGKGKTLFVETENRKLLIYKRVLNHEVVLVVNNLGHSSEQVNLSIAKEIEEVLFANRAKVDKDSRFVLLEGRGFVWLKTGI